MAIDASQVTHSANDERDWTDPADNVDGKLDELASKTLTAQAGLTDNAIMRADGTEGKTQDGPITESDGGALSEVESITGKAAVDFTITTKSGNALNFTAFGGAGTATENGGFSQIEGGQSGSTSGDGGDANVIAGAAITLGKGGSVNITAKDGAGTDKDGGNVNLTSGNATGSGTAGRIIIVSDTVFNEASADKEFRIESDGDANNFVSDGGTNRIGIGMLSPNEKLQVADAIALSNNTEGNTGRLTRRTSHETHTLAAATTSDTTTISIPSGARLLAVSMNVDTAVVNGDFLDRWSAAFITGSTTTIATDSQPIQNTKVNFIVPDEKTTAVTEVQFTAKSGSFSAGVIEVVAYYEELTSLADV